MIPAISMERAAAPAGGRLRAATRVTAFLALSGLLYVVRALGAAARRVAGRPAGPWRTRITGIWARNVARLLGMQIEIDGSPPRPPFLLVANHLSYVDILALAACVDCVFVSRADAARWPVLGALSRGSGTIFIDRDRRSEVARAVGEIQRALDQGLGVVLFPEGTSTAGDDVMPFRPSLLEVASRASLPVSWACLSYRTPRGGPSARQVVCWWGDMTLVPHLSRLITLPGFRAEVRFGDVPIRDPDRKRLAARLREAVLSRFVAVEE